VTIGVGLASLRRPPADRRHPSDMGWYLGDTVAPGRRSSRLLAVLGAISKEEGYSRQSGVPTVPVGLVPPGPVDPCGLGPPFAPKVKPTSLLFSHPPKYHLHHSVEHQPWNAAYNSCIDKMMNNSFHT
jgi:hypothetical protein